MFNWRSNYERMKRINTNKLVAAAQFATGGHRALWPYVLTTNRLSPIVHVSENVSHLCFWSNDVVANPSS